MKIRSIRLVNYLCFEDTTVEFAPGFNVVAGINGSGKTSLLRGIHEILNVAISSSNSAKHLAYDAAIGWNRDNVDQVARIAHFSYESGYRFEKQYPVEINATAEDNKGKIFDVSIIVKKELGAPATSGNRDFLFDSEGKTGGLSLFYRSTRNWQSIKKTAPVNAVSKKISRLDAYESWWDASLDKQALQEWLISKSIERLQTESEARGENIVIEDELSFVNAALAEAIPELSGIRFDFKQKSVFVDWKETGDIRHEPTAFENLSDGQRVLIALVADIARRMCILNPHLGSAVVRDTPGIVLIDELDLHLHPRWQRRLPGGLKRAFPSVQFIVTTHSPQVLGELTPEEIILLEDKQAIRPLKSYGLDSSSILSEIMDTPPRPEEVKQKLDELFATLEKNDLLGARAQIEELSNEAPSLPELSRAKALMRRKEAIGR